MGIAARCSGREGQSESNWQRGKQRQLQKAPFFTGGFKKRTAISSSNKLDVLGERKGVWLDSGDTAEISMLPLLQIQVSCFVAE